MSKRCIHSPITISTRNQISTMWLFRKKGDNVSIKIPWKTSLSSISILLFFFKCVYFNLKNRPNVLHRYLETDNRSMLELLKIRFVFKMLDFRLINIYCYRFIFVLWSIINWIKIMQTYRLIKKNQTWRIFLPISLIRKKDSTGPLLAFLPLSKNAFPFDL